MSEQATLGSVEEKETEENPELISGVAWSEMEGFPKDWEAKNLEGSLTLQTGNNFPSENFVDEGGLPLIRIRDLPTGQPETNYKGDYDESYLIKPKDLLVGMDGEFKPYLWKGEKALLNQRILKIESDEYNKFFLRYALEKPLRYIQKSISGTTVKHLSQTNVKSINLPTPEREEQEKIASVLYNVDQAIQKTEEIIEQTQRVKKGLMQDLFTQGYYDHDNYKKTHLGPKEVEIPENWKKMQIRKAMDSNIIEKQQDGNHGNDYPRKDEFVEEGIPYVSAKMLKNGQLDFNDAKYLTQEKVDSLRIGFAKNGDVLLAHNATVGATGIVNYPTEPVIIGTSLTYYRCNQDEVDNQYLMYYFQSQLFQNQLESMMRQTTRNQVPITTQRMLSLIIPPLKEQRKIAETLSQWEEALTKQERYKAQLQRIKKGLMQDLLTGEVRTHDENLEVLEEVKA